MDAERIRQLQYRYGLSYHIDYALLAEQLVGLRGQRVVEVGGSLPAGLVLDDFGAARWTAIEEPDYWDEALSTGQVQGTPPDRNAQRRRLAEADRDSLGRHQVLFGRVEALPETLLGAFDRVFSIAAFEHIARLPAALEKMHAALVPGGRLFSLFAPIWSCYNGHHLPELVDEAGRRWNFTDSPIPPWGHLLLRPMELFDVLCTRTDAATAREIVYFVQQSPHISRHFVEDYQAIVARSPFRVERLEPMFPATVPPAVQAQLERLHPSRGDFSHCGLLLVLRRTDG